MMFRDEMMAGRLTDRQPSVLGRKMRAEAGAAGDFRFGACRFRSGFSNIFCGNVLFRAAAAHDDAPRTKARSSGAAA